MSTATGIYALMLSWAKQHGTASVDQACKKWKKEGRYEAGPEATKRIRMSSQQRRSLVKKLWVKQGGVCARQKHAVQLKDATLDHFEPVSLGGAEKLSNYRMVCGSHNSAKGSNTPLEESKATGQTVLEGMPK